MKNARGFTLVELLVTITIMAILTAIVWPLFTQQKLKSWRQDCISGIAGISQAMEEWRNSNGTYNPAGINNYKPALNNNNLQQCQQRGYKTGAAPFSSCNNACRITVVVPDSRAAAPADSYLVTATRFYTVGTPNSDKDTDCNIFAMNDLGQKSATTLAGATSTLTPGNAAETRIKATCWLEN